MKEIQEQLVAGFPGSFDPFQNGHLSTAISFLKLHQKAILYIVIGINEEKENDHTFSTEEKVFLIEQSIPAEYKSRVKVVSYSGIIANWFYEQNVSMFVKGVRDSRDFEYTCLYHWSPDISGTGCGLSISSGHRSGNPHYLTPSRKGNRFTSWALC